jgi:uncharacterized protein (DUF58 family)
MPTSYGALLDALRGVRWPARRNVAAGAPGAHRSSQRGTAGEFTEYRLYRQGDDPRALDWKLLARSDRAFVRLTDDRAVLPTWLLVDASASMAFPSADAADSKWAIARAFTVGLAAIAHGGGDPVGMLVATASGDQAMPARTRRGTVTAIAGLLDAVRCEGRVALAPLLARVPSTARIVIVSDALGDDEAQRQMAAPLIAGGASLLYVHVVAAGEVDPGVSTFRARDPEARHSEVRQPASQHPEVRSPTSIYRAADREAYQQAFSAFRADVADQWRRLGASYGEVRTDEDLPHAIRRHIATMLGGPS